MTEVDPVYEEPTEEPTEEELHRDVSWFESEESNEEAEGE